MFNIGHSMQSNTAYTAYKPNTYMVMFLFSIVPLAGNTVTIATLLDVKPEKMSLTVFISTLISLFYIPLMIFLYTS